MDEGLKYNRDLTKIVGSFNFYRVSELSGKIKLNNGIVP
jgi:hypothetical protein